MIFILKIYYLKKTHAFKNAETNIFKSGKMYVVLENFEINDEVSK